MADKNVVVELLLQRHIRKYVRLNLHSQSRSAHPYSGYLSRLIADHAGLRLEVAPTQSRLRGHLRLRVVGGMYKINTPGHRRLVEEVTMAFLREFTLTVDHTHLILCQPMGSGIQLFRSIYDITEEDWPFDTARRVYQRHLRKEHPAYASMSRPGRPRKPPGTLNARYRRALEQRAAAAVPFPAP